MRLYLGSYGNGVAAVSLEAATGSLASVAAVADTPEPSYLALSADGRFLYAVNELAEGTVTAFAVAPDGGLRALGARSTHGAQPCQLSTHPDGFVLTANYGSGSVAAHPVAADGALGEVSDVVSHTGSGPDRERQQGPHAHQALVDPAGRFVLVTDLGADAVFTYRLDGGALRLAGELRLRPGAGPRTLAFHPSGGVAYVSRELDNAVTACGYDAERGRLTPLRTVPAAPEGGERNYPSEVLVSPGGRFVYVANRGHDSVAWFAADDLTALGQAPCGGRWPRHTAFTHGGRLLHVANQNSDGVATFAVGDDGALTPVGHAARTRSPTMVLPSA